MSIKEPEAHQDTDGQWAIFSTCTKCGEEIWLTNPEDNPDPRSEIWEHRWTETIACLATTYATPDGERYTYAGPNGEPQIITEEQR